MKEIANIVEWDGLREFFGIMGKRGNGATFGKSGKIVVAFYNSLILSYVIVLTLYCIRYLL
ncbi:MAG: hypothetical protein J5523_05030 [Muribaculaceae bacterium]|nr:hypothetical protein [Muribaculaceae bacterium]